MESKDLVEERDKYGANDVTPGLTGWAKINGRDELEIPDKAKLDGDYVKEVKSNSRNGLLMDIRCFFGTVKSVSKAEGVVEGGTGEMHKALREGVPKKIQKKTLLIKNNSQSISQLIKKY